MQSSWTKLVPYISTFCLAIFAIGCSDSSFSGNDSKSSSEEEKRSELTDDEDAVGEADASDGGEEEPDTDTDAADKELEDRKDTDTATDLAGVETERFFTEDGGEFIFQLKNGLPGYFVVGRDHNRISQPPAVRSPTGVAEVFVGRTCMNCHKTGLIIHRDQMRDRTLEIEMSPEERQLVNALYPPNETLLAQYKSHNEKILKATRLLKVNEDRPEPVTSLSRIYEEVVAFDVMAAELGVTLDEWKAVFVDPNDPDQKPVNSQIINTNPNILVGGLSQVQNPFLGNLPPGLTKLDRTFSSQIRNGRVTRDSFERNFSISAKHFHGGVP